MADFIKTINNSVNLFGEGPCTKWGQANGFAYTMVWGTTRWGEGSFSLVFSVEKLIENSQAVTGVYQRHEFDKVLANTLVTDFETDLESLRSGIWDIVFPSDTINAEDRDFASYTTQGASANSWTCLAAGSSNWS